MNKQQRPDGQTLDRLVSRNLHAKHTWILRTSPGASMHCVADDVLCDAGEASSTEQLIVEASALGGSPITCTDLRIVAKEAHVRGDVVVCDNTLATSFGCPAARLGADIVLEGLSHALGAAGDNLVAVSLSAEFLAAHPETAARLEAKRPDNALVDDFADAYLRWDTVRKRQNDAALAIAEYLVCHPKVARVWYPGLLRNQRDSSLPDPANAVAPAILTGGFGPVVDFELIGGSVPASSADAIAGEIPSAGERPSTGEILSAGESRESFPQMHAMGGRLIRLTCTLEDAIAQARTVEQALLTV